MSAPRQISLTGEQTGLGWFQLSGIINEASGVLSGTLTLISGEDNSVATETITGTISAIGAVPEDLHIAPIAATPTMAVGGSAQIATDGNTALNLAGTAPDGVTLVAVTLNGTATPYVVQFETPQIGESGLEVINGVTVNEPCALADQLRAVRLQLIAGQSVSRTEFNGRSLYFHRASLEELTKEIARLDAQCAAASGITSTTPDLTRRTRRQIRINPYS